MNGRIYAVILALFLSLSGCIFADISKMDPQAQVELMKREVSIRIVGMTAIDPSTGIIFCVICWATYSRNMPNPDPNKVP